MRARAPPTCQAVREQASAGAAVAKGRFVRGAAAAEVSVERDDDDELMDTGFLPPRLRGAAGSDGSMTSSSRSDDAMV